MYMGLREKEIKIKTRQKAEEYPALSCNTIFIWNFINEDIRILVEITEHKISIFLAVCYELLNQISEV